MLQTITSWYESLFNSHAWIGEVITILILMLLVSAIETRLFHQLLKKVQRTKHFWDEVCIRSIHMPLQVFIWLLGITLSAELASVVNLASDSPAYIPQIRKIGILILSFWFVFRFIRQFETHYLSHAAKRDKELDKTLIHAVSQLLVAIVFIVGLLMGMQLFGLPISGLLAFGGIGGAGVAFAAKDLLANFFGGLVIYADRPFKVGEWIQSPDRNIQGVVEYIGWRATRIRTFEKRPLYVPNGTFLTISVENPSRMTNRRIKTVVGVRYDDSQRLKTILSDVETMLRSHPEIDTKQLLLVNLIEFGPSSLNFMIYTFTKTTQWAKFQAVQQDVFMKVLDIISGHGAECAFPTTTLHMPSGLNLKKQE